MKRYIEHIKNTRTTHQRRQHAMAALFAVWLGTLGVRLSSPSDVAQTANDTTQTASVAAAVQNNSGPQLQVSTTSVFQ